MYMYMCVYIHPPTHIHTHTFYNIKTIQRTSKRVTYSTQSPLFFSFFIYDIDQRHVKFHFFALLLPIYKVCRVFFVERTSHCFKM